MKHMLQALNLNEEVKAMAEELKDEQSCLVFGRGRNYATAMEAALKVSRWC
jgi:glucosamine--fructose-6-phosphate aminotransferase (isomerizing)